MTPLEDYVDAKLAHRERVRDITTILGRMGTSDFDREWAILELQTIAGLSIEAALEMVANVRRRP